jgi:hypothetical protein
LPRTDVTLQATNFQSYNQLFSDATAFDDVNGMMFANNGNTTVYINNTTGGTINITVTSVQDEALRTGNLTIAIDTTQIVRINNLRPAWWNQKSGTDAGKVYIDSDTGAGVYIYAINEYLTTTA